MEKYIQWEKPKKKNGSAVKKKKELKKNLPFPTVKVLTAIKLKGRVWP